MRTVAAGALACAALAAVLAIGAAAQAPPARIVSTSPSITETLFALGLGPQVVGVSQYCRYPPEVIKLPKVGTFLQPDAERIVALRPDLVFVNGVASRVADRLQSMHIRALEVNDGAMTSVFDTIRTIAGGAGVAARGDALV